MALLQKTVPVHSTLRPSLNLLSRKQSRRNRKELQHTFLVWMQQLKVIYSNSYSCFITSSWCHTKSSSSVTSSPWPFWGGEGKTLQLASKIDGDLPTPTASSFSSFNSSESSSRLRSVLRPSCPSTKLPSFLLHLARSRILLSIDLPVTKRYTRTGFVWPILWHRSGGEGKC